MPVRKRELSAAPRRKRLLLYLPLLLLAVLILAAAIYLEDYYHAGGDALRVLDHPAPSVTVRREKNRVLFLPDQPVAGVIFYPGAKVQYEAYAPLMEACAERGVLCVLLRMPGNLAVLGREAASGIAAEFPEVADWYIGGHSLGGAMAASYACAHSGELEGLILLAAYSTGDLSQSGLRVLSIYGSADGVLNMEKYNSARNLLPAGTREVVLEGGCHAFFGSYGPQKGDGQPGISREEQLLRTAEEIAAFLTDAAEAAA